MPTFGKVNAKQLILEGNRAKRSFIRKEDSLSARKMTGFSLSREVTDRKARELAQKYKESGIIKTHKTAWKVWHDAKKRELEAGMKEKSKGEKMTTAQLRERMKKTAERNVVADRALRQARGENVPEEKKSSFGIDRSDAQHSVRQNQGVNDITREKRYVSMGQAMAEKPSPPSTQSMSGGVEKKSDPLPMADSWLN